MIGDFAKLRTEPARHLPLDAIIHLKLAPATLRFSSLHRR